VNVISKYGSGCLNYVRLWNEFKSGLLFIFFDSQLLNLLVEFGNDLAMIDGTWKFSGDKMQVVTLMVRFHGTSKIEKDFGKPFSFC